MKRIVLLLATAMLASAAFAQVRPARSAEEAVRPHTFRLANGLKVIVAEDHSEPKIFGAVIVHAGSKNEDTAATGVAHYFEHIMFKGTDRIGTTNWEREKPYLDSISELYDKMHDAKHDTTRHRLQLEINRLNIAASQYAIANETDAILQQMGCTGLNAGTTYDYTVYYNYLPSNQLENWMEVYAERFRNPVYRLFQGELEAVYEERNIYANNMLYTFSRNLFTESFGDHPYSRDIIGLDEHLKCPQPSAMKKFYDKYYVANNMTLLLVGDVNVANARQMAERYFGGWPSGRRAQKVNIAMPKFDSRVVKTVKQTPIKAGMMIFPGVPTNHRDELALNVMNQILCGRGGMMDKLVSDGRLMAAELAPLTLEDGGTNVVIYIPKLVGQKHEQAEELIWECIDSMKTGGYSDDLLQAIKTRLSVERKRQLETLEGVAMLLEELECSGSGYEQWLFELRQLERLTKADIQRVALQYFDRDHCTIVRSNMGFPKKDAAIKPDWDHLNAQNQGVQSAFAKAIARHEVPPVQVQEIDFQRDVLMQPITRAYKLYSAPNPRNDIFTLTIAYHYGTADDVNISPAATYFNNLGAGNMDLQQYQLALDKLGGNFSVSTSYDYTYFQLSGPEANFDDIMGLALRKLQHPLHDKKQIDKLVEEAQAAKQAAANDAETWFSALTDYVDYGDQSDYIRHTTIKQLKQLEGEQLMDLLNQVFTRDGYVTFVGNIDPNRVATTLRRSQLVHEAVTTVPRRIQVPKSYSDNTVFYVSNSQFLKSDIGMSVQSRDFDYPTDRAAASLFNEYMGGGMNSVFFQEIREFRALGYHTYARFRYDHRNRYRSYFYGYLGTQCDKTLDGIDAMHQLMVRFPNRKDKFVPARDYLLASMASNYISFRSMPATVRNWREEYGLEMDPRPQMMEEVRHLRFDDLQDFFHKYVENRPMVITVSGNAKKAGLKQLKQYGTVKQVKMKDIIKF